ncbi:helix-turn-helix domain-containing protein [Lentilactobacillus rapi]|uniref:helix-turn-helix domain-containing protein n=1 Tax=Lentilactobacillus rapi TaxID=481723 RepID=UPI0006D2743F|nr:helix-turn-helix transcriptional regulator [Lentilactobacillus rapi]
MIDYGKTFKHLREQKGISITSAANGVVSKSFLSRFERGLSDISFDKLIRLLTNINISAEEFIYLAHYREQQPLEFHYEETKDYIGPKESVKRSEKN